MEISSMDGAFGSTLNDNQAPITTNNNTEHQNHLSTTFGERENNFIPMMPKPEVKIKKLDETKMITDSNENSLSVDTLIEILSSNGTNLPETSSSSISNNKKSSESSSSSSSKATAKVKNEKSSAVGRSPSSTKNSNKSISSAKTANSNSKLASPFGGKPTITDLNRKMKQAAAKRQPRTVYQSQIKDNSVGIKICIKKSINSHKKVPSGSSKTPTTIKKRSRKSKLKERESDSEDGYVKKRKRVALNSANDNESNANDGSVQEQSRWARELPKEILFDVSIHMQRVLCELL